MTLALIEDARSKGATLGAVCARLGGSVEVNRASGGARSRVRKAGGLRSHHSAMEEASDG